MDALAIGSHPDDVEIACGATLALLAKRGRRVGILHLSCGEGGTRGTTAERRVEAEDAAAALGAVELDFLDFGDGRMRTGQEEEDLLIERIRHWRPALVLGPGDRDRHPDHGRTHRLVEDACFYAGLASRGDGTAHRPPALFRYMPHDPFEPSFIVDVSETWDQKLQALAAYKSQLHQPEDRSGRREPATKVASAEYWHAIEGRARHYGMLINAEFGEPFGSRLPVAVRDPFDLVPGGLA